MPHGAEFFFAAHMTTNATTAMARIAHSPFLTCVAVNDCVFQLGVGA